MRGEVTADEVERFVTRVEKRFDDSIKDLRSDLFGDKGLSARVRDTEHKVAVHGVWVKIVSMVVGVVLLAVVARAMNPAPGPAGTVATSVGGH